METPLYEYDQVITCQELSNITLQLVTFYNRTPKVRWIERMKTKAQIEIIQVLHEALHMKTIIMNQNKGETK